MRKPANACTLSVANFLLLPELTSRLACHVMNVLDAVSVPCCLLQHCCCALSLHQFRECGTRLLLMFVVHVVQCVSSLNEWLGHAAKRRANFRRMRVISSLRSCAYDGWIVLLASVSAHI